ncbi:hypothetical protein HPB52_025572 [Rhipicephalus sanguineus]|uniref:Uncharacterized protein n=1 Tax=Rhipicephalus sanguineus TaxID=34632 RepID=A0A9D4TCW6_RHISA|nr:hypothetical protein HPB52_025572 [Rhipicephalus sanguineus]
MSWPSSLLDRFSWASATTYGRSLPAISYGRLRPYVFADAQLNLSILGDDVADAYAEEEGQAAATKHGASTVTLRLAVSAGARTIATRGAAVEAAEKGKAQVTSTNPQCDKSAGGRRVSSLKAVALTGEVPLKELDHTDSSDPDSGRKRLDSQTQGRPAVSRARQQRRRWAGPARKTPANPACGAKRAAAFKGSEKDEKNKAEDAVESWQADSEEGYAVNEKEQRQSNKKEERATTNRDSKATSLTTAGKNKNDKRLFFSQWGGCVRIARTIRRY